MQDHRANYAVSLIAFLPRHHLLAVSSTGQTIIFDAVCFVIEVGGGPICCGISSSQHVLPCMLGRLWGTSTKG